MLQQKLASLLTGIVFVFVFVFASDSAEENLVLKSCYFKSRYLDKGQLCHRKPALFQKGCLLSDRKVRDRDKEQSWSKRFEQKDVRKVEQRDDRSWDTRFSKGYKLAGP